MTSGLLATGDLALVLVRASSPFLSRAALTQREAACSALAGAVAAHVEVIPRTAESGGGPVDQLCRRAIETGAGTVITWSAFGLVASPDELTQLSGLLDAGVELFEANTGRLVPATTRRLAETLSARPSSAASESHLHAVRTREGRQAVAREGGWLGGRCPLGWVVDGNGNVALVLVAAGHIRTATNRVAAGTKVGAVAAQWNAAGFTTVTGRRWTFGSTRRVLLRARNAGLVEYQGNIVGRSAWPAIVTVPEWNRARRRLVSRPDQEIA